MRRTLPLLATIATISIGCGPDVYPAGELPAKALGNSDGKTSIVLVGDIMTWDRSREYLEEHGAAYPFAALGPLLRDADLAVGNLEGPVSADAKQAQGRFVYKVPPWTLAGLKSAGFDLLGLANNHTRDCGSKGVRDTLANLDRSGIGHFGAGQDRRAAVLPRIATVNGVRIAFLGMVAAETYFTEHEDSLVPGAHEKTYKAAKRRFGARPGRAGTIVATPEVVTRAVRAAKQQADLVVLFIHFGIRYHRPPTSFQQKVAHAAIDAGAGLVVGHHAHFWQPVEVYRSVPVVYGVGNFAFGSDNRRADEGLLVRATIDKHRVEQLELFPPNIKNKDSAVRYQPKLLKGASAMEMIERLAGLSAAFGARISLENERGVLRLEDRDKEL